MLGSHAAARQTLVVIGRNSLAQFGESGAAEVRFFVGVVTQSIE